VILLNNDTMAATILPAAGGNISEIIDLRTGRNWLWQNPHIPISNQRCGENYGRELDSGGWDEVLLSITPEQIDIPDERRLFIKDHGDLVRQQWAAEKIKDQRGNDCCVMSVAGSTLAYDFHRVVTLHRERPQLDIAYAVSNNESFSWPWYWCAHVLLNVQPNLKINLPRDLPFRLDKPSHVEHRFQEWPMLELANQEVVDLSDSFTVNAKLREFSSKIFARAPQSGSVDITIPNSDERLTMRFDPEVLPWLGLWINNRGWSGCGSEPYQNLGIEPSTVPYDSVSTAIDRGEITWLKPGETRQWSVSVELSA
jgi:galactose mutarotase-like enzyme